MKSCNHASLQLHKPSSVPVSSRKGISYIWNRKMKKHWRLYLLISLPVSYIIIFCYIPMGGILLAFKNYNIRLGILDSPWAGFKYFNQFFLSPQFGLTIRNTLGLSLYSLAAGFPMPIILALALNEIGNVKFKKSVQMVTYAPYFISTVVMVSMILQFLDLRGPLNGFVSLLGGKPQNYIAIPGLFKSIYVWSGIWQSLGYNAIIYIAALSGIPAELYEAAKIDGATRLQKIKNIDIPGITPTIVILLILSFGSIMSVGFEKVFLMQNSLNLSSSEIIATYVYKVGLVGAQYSFSTAVGLFNSIVNLILIIAVNKISQKISDTSLW